MKWLLWVLVFLWSSGFASLGREAWDPFRPLARPSVGSVDEFIEAGWTGRSLAPTGRASREVLLRRLSFDLLGLPPSLEEMDAFLKDSDLNAWERVVDRLLASPHFGERWARYWLDVMRYSETKGHVTDIERPFAWKYRDYVIDAFNVDLPYERFVREHIAGDLVDPRPGLGGEVNIAPTATGALFFHEMHFMAVDPVKQRWDEIDAQIDVISKAFLGLTVACARCHDHKTDPISQRDYYALAGYFYGTEQGTARVAPRGASDEGIVRAERAYQKFLDQKREGRRKAQSAKNQEYFPISEELGVQTRGDASTLQKLTDALKMVDPTWSHWVRAAVDVRGVDVPLLIRGDYRTKGEPVRRRFLHVLGSGSGLSSDAGLGGDTSGRLELADALATHPLGFRVWVNRLWFHLFGRGLQATPSDFGSTGGTPSHPDLLDYLASQFAVSGGSTKAIVREIVLSQTYQRASAVPRESDPENRWLAHQNRRRLQAEPIRDAILSVSGHLDRALLGESVSPWVPPHATANKEANIPLSGPVDGLGRRSVYVQVRRNFPEPFLKIFDFPDPGLSIGKRDVTSPPSQALAMMNSPFVHDQAHRWATKAMSAGESISEMFRQALGRAPLAGEVAALEALATRDEVAHVILNLTEFRYVD